MMDNNKLVLVTGGSGFIAVYCILQCLAEGYSVRATVRSLKRESDVRKTLELAGATNLDKLSFVEADLSADDGWKEAVANCSYVLHVASPFPASVPKDENDLIVPARDGALRVLRAARDAGVIRVVLTSSSAAIEDGHPQQKEPFTEETWTDVNKVAAYPKSKTIAERAAWDFIKAEGGSLELSVVNPALVLGPVLSTDISPSIIIIERLLKGDLPGCPQLTFGIVDVRDVADLHLRCMRDPKAKGERFIAVASPSLTIKEISLALRERLGNAARKAPTWVLPNIALRVMAYFDPAVAVVVPNLGVVRQLSNDKAKSVLGWDPRSNTDAVVATAESLIDLGIVKV